MPRIDTPIITSESNLDTVLWIPLPKLLIFYRHSLPEMLNQTMKNLARQEAEKLLIVKIDLAENPNLIKRYQIGAGTTILALKDQQEVGRTTDLAQVEKYAAYLLGQSDQLPQQEATPTHNNPTPIHVTERTFDQTVLHNQQPVLVDFWATWCAPCRMIAPILERLAVEFAGKITIAKVNTDENPYLTNDYRIHGIPALLLFKNGKAVDRIVGAAPEATLRQFIQRHI